MYGKNSEKICWVFIGNTNGSKSIIQKMIRIWLGDYYCDLPAEFFSGKKMGTSGPSPELAQTENTRVAVTAEPDDDEPWSGARIKKLSGGDSFFTRKCGEDGGSVETTFKNIVVLNIIPDFKGLDEATKLRLYMVPFEGRWIKSDEKSFKVPDTFEEQVKAKLYPMDPRFEDNLPRLACALNWYCVQNYKKYLEEGLQKPKYIEKFIDNYWKQNDPYTAFIDENLEVPKKEDGSVDDNKYITTTDLYPVYKKWFKGSYPGFSIVPKAKLTTFLSSPDRLGKQRVRRWYGYSIRMIEETIDV
jgi:phage/plasmid-associated DNA primase